MHAFFLLCFYQILTCLSADRKSVPYSGESRVMSSCIAVCINFFSLLICLGWTLSAVKLQENIPKKLTQQEELRALSSKTCSLIAICIWRAVQSESKNC